MAEGSRDVSGNQEREAPEIASTAKDEAYQAARAQFSARRAYKRALRQARNPLYFSLRSLALLVALVVVGGAVTLALVFALRGEPAPTGTEPIIHVVASSTGGPDAVLPEQPEATSIPAVQVILAAETPESLILEGPAIPTVIITNTPTPLSVGARAAVFGVGNDKLNIRSSPSLSGSQILFREGEGKQFEIIGGPRQADGYTWWQVRDTEYQVQGWAVANYLRTILENTG